MPAALYISQLCIEYFDKEKNISAQSSTDQEKEAIFNLCDGFMNDKHYFITLIVKLRSWSVYKCFVIFKFCFGASLLLSLLLLVFQALKSFGTYVRSSSSLLLVKWGKIISTWELRALVSSTKKLILSRRAFLSASV